MFMEFSRQEYCSGLPFPTPGYLPNPGLEPKSPALQADSFPPETPGKPKQSLWNSPGKNTGAGCHFLLQGIFPNQGLNPSLLHCRQILYHLSHQGSPIVKTKCFQFLASMEPLLGYGKLSVGKNLWSEGSLDAFLSPLWLGL